MSPGSSYSNGENREGMLNYPIKGFYTGNLDRDQHLQVCFIAWIHYATQC